MNSGFLDKLIERIGRVRPEDVQSYLLRLADEKGFLETIFNAIHEGVIVTDLQGRVNYLNRAACELFGLEREQCQGHALGETIRGFDWEQLVESNKVVSRDMEIFYPQHRFINFYVVPLFLEKPQPRKKTIEREMVAHAVILRDITENRRSTEETIQSERLSALTLLAAGVAHELGQSAQLAAHPSPAHGAQAAQSAALRAAGAARRARDRARRNPAARLDHPAIPRRDPPHAARSLRWKTSTSSLRECVAFLQPEISDRNILVEQELRADLPLLELDRTQIKQAFFNVIKNAFQAMRTGGILRIQTRSRRPLRARSSSPTAAAASRRRT